MPKIRILSLLVLIIATTAVTLPSFIQTVQAASPDSSIFFTANAETFLEADGPGGVDTYKLISNAGMGNESPDLYSNNHPGTRHIVEKDGSPYGPYFTFIIHDRDSDRATDRNRQRNEIKGDGKSPAKLQGKPGETVRYHWYFRPAANYNASETMFFQLHSKSDGPIFKLETIGSSNPALTVRHDPNNCNCSSERNIASTPFNPLRGQWLEVEVFVTYGNSGWFLLTLRDESGNVKLQVEKNKIDTFSGSFVRPKWGIYRGTKNVNAQDTVDFANITVQEITLLSSPPANQAPKVNAGTDQTVILPGVASLNGSVTDDGLPNPPAATTTTWSMVSGPGSVTFGSSSAPATTASFSHAGVYVLQLMASDNEMSASDDVTITVDEPSQTPVGHWTFDEGAGSQASDSSGNGNHGVISGATPTTGLLGGALSFDSIDDYVAVPTNLWNPAQGTLAFWAQGRDFSQENNFFGHTSQPPFGNRIQLYTLPGSRDLNLGLGDAHERRMGIATLQPDQWHHLALTWDGAQYRVYVDGQEAASGSYTGLTQFHSVADIGNLGRSTRIDGEAMDGMMDDIRVYNRPLSGSEIAELAQVNNTPPVNQEPQVDAGADQTVTLPAAASLSGVVSDDGLPNPPAATTIIWSMVSGPGSVTFGDPSAPVTTASFSHAGNYVLQLMADDNDLSASANVTITVEPEPVAQPFSPVGHWTFDEGAGSQASDSSGNGNHGSITGAAPATGLLGGALSFDGNDDFIEVKTNQWNAGQGTVALWAKAKSFSKAGGLTSYLFGHTTQPPYGNRIQLYVDAPDGYLSLGLGNSHSTRTKITKLAADQWHHVALTWDGASYVVYVDGEQVAQGAYAGLTAVSPAADIGNNGGKRDEAFDGIIDEVRVYSHPLSASEIADLAEVYITPPVDQEPSANQGPQVDAGADQAVILPGVASLNGVVSDDGLPNPPATTSVTWSMVSGPGSATFGDPGAPVTTASFSHPGEYVLTLTADDGQVSVSDDIAVTVVVYGDSNQDGQLTAEDIHFALDWLFGHSPTPSVGSASYVATDVNNDGVIDSNDVSLIINRLLSQA